MRTKALLAASCFALLVGGTATAGTAAMATYDATTGELIFQLNDSIAIVGVESIGNFRTDQTPGTIDGVPNVQFDADVLAFFDQNGLGQGTFNVGTVLAPGLTAGDLGFSYTPVGGQSTQADVLVVPEPGSLALLGLGGLALLRRRRAA